METWTPLEVFAITCCASALAGLAGYLRSDKPLSLRSMVAAVLYPGALGAGASMIGYEWFGGKEKPWRVIGVGILVGLGVLGQEEIKSLFTRILGSGGGGRGNGE